ncbi:MAG: LCP family protein [Clostridia bacterium]|nr:LCP family protein [Clostridiales bacterium]MDO4829070.1 LCP family protein [Clostridia bacterium]
MRRFLSLLLALVLLMGVMPAQGEEAPRRGAVQIVDEAIEGEDGTAEDAEGGLFDDDNWVEDPLEEILFDDQLITDAFDKLDGMRNILLLGVDSRTGSISGRTDTMILLSVDIEGNVIKMTSFLRDTYVSIPGYKNNRLNAAYVYGGFDLLAATFEENFGIRPDAYVAVNLSGLTRVIDELGGVYVDVNSKKIDRINAVIYWYNKQVLNLNNLRDGYLTKGGRQKLTGKQAEAWARYRYSESDMQRAERQRQLISIIFEEICKMSLSELVSFAMDNIDLVKTNLGISDIISLAPAVLAMRDAEIRELQIPVSGGYKSQTVSGMSVLVPNRQKNANALAEFLKAK